MVEYRNMQYLELDWFTYFCFLLDNAFDSIAVNDPWVFPPSSLNFDNLKLLYVC